MVSTKVHDLLQLRSESSSWYFERGVRLDVSTHEISDETNFALCSSRYSTYLISIFMDIVKWSSEQKQLVFTRDVYFRAARVVCRIGGCYSDVCETSILGHLEVNAQVTETWLLFRSNLCIKVIKIDCAYTWDFHRASLVSDVLLLKTLDLQFVNFLFLLCVRIVFVAFLGCCLVRLVRSQRLMLLNANVVQCRTNPTWRCRQTAQPDQMEIMVSLQNQTVIMVCW